MRSKIRLEVASLASDLTDRNRTRKLLDRHAFGEVARLVHVQTAGLGDVVGEELQRHGGDEGGQYLRYLRHRKRDLRHAPGRFIALAGYGYHPCPAGDGLLDVG